MNEIREKLVESFALVFPELDQDQIPTASTETVGDWDSLASVNLIAILREEFGVDFEIDEYEEFNSFASILALLENKLKAQ